MVTRQRQRWISKASALFHAVLRTFGSILLGLLLIVGCTGRSTAQIENSNQLRAALDSAAAAYAADSTIAGVSVAVLHKGDTLLLEGYGRANLEFDVPMPRDAVYEVGSITKQFTAAAILQLVGTDSLALDAEITEYLPEYNTRGHTVTIRQLLHHTSGLRSYTGMSSFRKLSRQSLPRDTLLSLVEAEPFRFLPGTAMSYSNTGYFLLGRIIEAVSGQSYASYLAEHLLKPAGMEDSYYCDERSVTDRRAHGYSWDPERGFEKKAYLDHTWPFAAGSLCSTAPDLAAWNKRLHAGDILPDSLYHEMVTPGQLADGTSLRYGMGLHNYTTTSGRPVIGHGGDIPGYRSASQYYPAQELIIVALQNTTGHQAPQRLVDTLAHLILGPGEQPPSSTYDGDLTTLAGRYAGPGRGELVTLRVEAIGDALLVKELTASRETEADTLKHVAGRTWRGGLGRFTLWRSGLNHITFVRSGHHITELRYDHIGAHYVLRRIGGP